MNINTAQTIQCYITALKTSPVLVLAIPRNMVQITRCKISHPWMPGNRSLDLPTACWGGIKLAAVTKDKLNFIRELSIDHDSSRYVSFFFIRVYHFFRTTSFCIYLILKCPLKANATYIQLRFGVLPSPTRSRFASRVHRTSSSLCAP